MSQAWIAILVVAAVAIGHGGLVVAIYNRLGATGWPHRIEKRITTVLLVLAIAIPVLAFIQLGGSDVFRGGVTADDLWRMPIGWIGYGMACLAAWPLLGIPWLLARPILGIGHLKADRQIEVQRPHRRDSGAIALTRKSAWLARLPGNQILELAVERIELPVVGLPPRLDGYRIAHLSDLHFTGHVAPAWTAAAVHQLNDWVPDLVALTGDIIDSPECVDWLADALGHAQAPDGCYFILGNHDLRDVCPRRVDTTIRELGWTSVGGKVLAKHLRGGGETGGAMGVDALIIGNEAPWFPAPDLAPLAAGNEAGEAAPFRLLLSHGPDQFGWARCRGVRLMLAGHTHGGQGRLPLLGPILSPSWHGSRYAAGDFYSDPTTMHVSRGLSGTRLLRINCRPELSLLTLRVGD